ncbi:alpha/beta hydrolase [Pedobacter sp. JY14-1]|uniref:alpha/beta hydrolase n=1 Tax=Pedobacter sp. JY14-1 TaxID=3034151 RepID=UPI0023E11A7F|nr:alpha/beta hydrolase [Pedobacter sp. JY14-1]
MKYAIILLMALVSIQLSAQQVIPLYSGKIPGAKPAPADYREEAPLGQDKITRVAKVSAPTLTVYLPAKEKARGAAVIICPGGGYGILAIDHEGYHVAKRFVELGVAAFVLKYRLPSDAIMEDKSIGPLMDAQQAIYQVRRQAKQWNIDPGKIGIMGFSAGGHLASALTVHYDDPKIPNKENISLRPDFSILIYPVISFRNYTHQGSAINLIGKEGTEAQRDYFSSELHVTPGTPPTFLVHANDDGGVPVQNSILFNEALVRNKVKAEMHLYQGGGHGFGLNNKTTKDDWFERLKNWMAANSWL